MAHSIHRMVGFVAVYSPIPFMNGMEVKGPHTTDGDVNRHFRPTRFRSDPTTVRSADFKVITVHMDRVIGHGQVTDSYPGVIVL